MTRKGVWNLQQVRDKYLQSLWDNSPQLFGWGYNGYGQLGQNDVANRSSPTQITGDWSQFSGTSSSHSGQHGIKSDGTLWGWGRNNEGQLGLNNKTSYSSPVQIPGTTWAKVCSSKDYVIAVKTDGTLWTWGSNGSGMLGQNQGYSVQYSSPIQVGGSDDWATGFAGRDFTLAKKTNGELWAWGSASYGNLAQNDKTSRSSPVQIPGTWNSIGIGWFGCTASKTDGTLWSWGYGKHGNLGQNESSYKSYSSPTQIPGTTWNQATMNFYTSFATRTDGTLWSWGYNSAGSSGLLGQNQGQPSVASTSSPKQVPGTTWNKIEVGTSKMIATKTDGTLWTWGRNIYGSLGQNPGVAYISSPTQIGSDSTWTSISNSYFGGYAGKSPLTPSQL